MCDRRIVWTLALVASLASGCASSPPEPATRADAGAAAAPTPEREAHCRNLMYTERGARGRAAVNWTVYDHCLKAK